jgi:hypothetical protein
MMVRTLAVDAGAAIRLVLQSAIPLEMVFLAAGSKSHSNRLLFFCVNAEAKARS